MLNKVTVGQVEDVLLPGLNAKAVKARIDTGARTSAVWASRVQEADKQLEVIFFGKKSPLYSGQVVTFDDYAKATVTNSTGQTEERYKIRLLVEVGGRRIRAWFTLANRSRQVYPVLIGRNVLRGKFIVDVSHPKAAVKQTVEKPA